MSDIFLKIDGIAGDSEDSAHPGEIEVTSWQWKVSRYRARDSDLLYGNGKKGVGNMELVHRIDRSTPNLMRYCLTGTRIPKATLSMRHHDARSQDFFVVTMSNVLIDQVTPHAIGLGYFENLVLSFTSVREEYITSTGTGRGPVVTAMYDMFRQV